MEQGDGGVLLRVQLRGGKLSEIWLRHFVDAVIVFGKIGTSATVGAAQTSSHHRIVRHNFQFVYIYITIIKSVAKFFVSLPSEIPDKLIFPFLKFLSSFTF